MDNKKIKDKKQREINMMNWYYNNTNRLFRYFIIAFSILMFIFLIFILLPQTTRNGVSSSALKQTNIKQSDFAFVISPIDDRYSLDDAKKYTNQVVVFIDQRDNQVIYKATLDFLASNCNVKMNENTKYLFNTILNKANSQAFINKLDSENTVRRSNLEFCQLKEDNQLDNVSMSKLESQKAWLEYQIESQRKHCEYEKEVYGDAYDEKSCKTKYILSNSDEINSRFKKEQEIQSLEQELADVNRKLEKINNTSK